MSASTGWMQTAPVLLLCASNLFMTFAWYGHLKYRSAPLLLVILASWSSSSAGRLRAYPNTPSVVMRVPSARSLRCEISA